MTGLQFKNYADRYDLKTADLAKRFCLSVSTVGKYRNGLLPIPKIISDKILAIAKSECARKKQHKMKEIEIRVSIYLDKLSQDFKEGVVHGKKEMQAAVFNNYK